MRFRIRHVQQTIVDHLKVEMATLGWTGATPPLGAQAITFIELEPGDVEAIEPNTVAITIPEEFAQYEAELGPLREIRFPLFVDVYGERPSITISIASDIKDLLTDLVMAVTDYGQDPPVASDEQLEVEMVEVERPPASYGATDFKRNWRVVSADIVVYFQGV